MSFQNSGALAWLLPLVGIVVLLYLLKMRRRDVRVPATFLWPARTDEVRANSLFQKLRFSWLMVLQILALCLVVVALARPQVRQKGLAGEVTVIVLDTSASMSATDVRPSRFDEAKRVARETILSAKPTDRLALIEAGPTPRVVFPLSSDPAKQTLALDGVKPTDAEADTGEALRLASALVGGIDGARIVLLSDGDFDKVANFSRGKAALVYHAIGAFDDNLAISALGTTETPAGRQLYVGVRNTGTKPMEGAISLYADGHVLDSERMAAAPGKTWGRTLPAPSGAKVFEAKLDAPDVLKADNYAVTIADPGASLRVLLVSAGNPFLERALALDPRVTLDRAATLPNDLGDKYDIVVFDGVPEQPVKARGVLALGVPGPSSPVVANGTAKGPTFVSAEKKPLLDGVDLSGVFIDNQQVVRPKAQGEVLAQSSKGPLVVTAQSPAQRQIFLAFSPLQSDFPLQVAFPIFVGNALTFLGGEASSNLLAIKAGQSFSIPSRGPVTLKSPDGHTTRISPTGGAAIVRDVRTVGVYHLTADGKTKTIYATLRSDRESDIAPVRTLALGGGEVKATPGLARFADFWRPLALVCLLVLAGEWWLYARRS